MLLAVINPKGRRSSVLPALLCGCGCQAVSDFMVVGYAWGNRAACLHSALLLGRRGSWKGWGLDVPCSLPCGRSHSV